MRFTLHYRGPLKSNGSPEHKHEIRESMHDQLKILWSQEPLNENPRLLEPRRRSGEYSLLRPMPPFTFVPLITGEMNAVAELTVTMLRPERPGGLLTKGGDIDNRLKTLFDALTMPVHANQLPAGANPKPDQQPFFFCLLEDDNLVIHVSVRTEQLLEPNVNPNLIDTLIYVRTRVTRETMGNQSFS